MYSTNLAEGDASVQTVHEVVHVDVQLRIQHVEPLRQVLLHRVQVLLARLERTEGPRVLHHRRHLHSDGNR